MPVVNRSEITRDGAGRPTTTRLTAYDEFGREYYADVLHSICVGVLQSTVTNAVMTQLQQVAAAHSKGPGLVFDASAVRAIARTAGARLPL